MKQVLQSLDSGDTEVVDIPVPRVAKGHLLIANQASVISAGTERMLVEFGKANLLAKARQQPERIKQVLDKAKTDGVLATVDAVRSKLSQPIPLGYSCAGVVLAVGEGVVGFRVGDRVVSNGPHAEIVCIPTNLCAKIPSPDISFDEAAFASISAIALQGLRLAEPTLGECFVVTGLGLIGLIAVQLLVANGCRVIGVDFDPARLELARTFGASVVDLSKNEDPVEAGLAATGGLGVDGVLLAAATKSSDPVHQAASMCRKRGRIVLIGVTGLELSRADFYEKELTFQVSCSYGPGRYDPQYEEEGHDYPYGFVRWTEKRNLEAVLGLMATERLDVKPLISRPFPIAQANEAYAQLSDSDALGIVLTYPENAAEKETVQRTVSIGGPSQPQKNVRVGVVGAGNFTARVLLPALKNTSAELVSLASSKGLSGFISARKFGFNETTTDTEALLEDKRINAVVITTRHDSHADLVIRALKAGKHVFVEKPLAITREQLEQVEEAYLGLSSDSRPLLCIGFNRRFSSLTTQLKQLMGAIHQPKTMIMTVNAGEIPPEHWTQDPAVGGGRIIGEGCHFVDLLRFLVGAPITSVTATSVGGRELAVNNDKVSATLRFEDGSMGTVHYFANGHSSFPKERLEVFGGGRTVVLNNFRNIRGYGFRKLRRGLGLSQDKGHAQLLSAFVSAVEKGHPSPIPFDEIVEVTRATFDIAEAVG